MQGTRRYGSEEADPIDWIVSPSDNAAPGHMTTPGLSEMFAYHATTMANTIKTSLIVFSRKVRPRPGLRSSCSAIPGRVCLHTHCCNMLPVKSHALMPCLTTLATFSGRGCTVRSCQQTTLNAL